MTNDWTKVFTSQDAMKAELVKQILIENNIEAVILDKKGHPYPIGEVEVYVQPEHALDANAIVGQSDI